MKTDTPETDQMRISFYEGGGQEPDIFELCEKLERERNLEMGYRGEWCDKARKAESQLDELDVLREKADKAHQAFYTMRHDWKSCDFELPPLAIIHMEAITEKMKEMGKILFSLENAQQTCGESSDATETPNLLT